MTKRDFFRLLIKIFGLYSLILSVFTVVPQTLSSFVFLEEFMVILIALGSLFLFAFFCFILFFKVDLIIDKLKLDKGFDDEVIMMGNLDSSSILKLAIVVIGGFLVIEHVPSFLYHIVNAFKKEVSVFEIDSQKVDYYNLSVSLINIFLGYVLITNYKTIANYLNK